MKIAILLAVLCALYPHAESACTTCKFGYAFQTASGALEPRFKDTSADAISNAENARDALSFTISDATVACNSDICGVNSTCTDLGLPNTTVSWLFECGCVAGYSHTITEKLSTCNEIDECATNADNCHDNATCTNTPPGSFSCVCKTGFSGNGTNCTDVDDCSPDPCGNFADCADGGPNNHTCTCQTGYEGDPYANCTNIDECTKPSHNCHPSHGFCIDNNGSFACACNTGFTGNGVNCSDIDECSTSSTCDVNANCTNSVGSFSCVCKTGFTGNGTHCTNINDCTNVTYDTVNGFCNDLVSGYVIGCNTGYTGNGTVCTEIDECAIPSHNCDVNADCTNTPGSFSCACKSGYFGDGVTLCTTRQPLNATFFIYCTSFNWTTDLWNTSSAAYTTLSTDIQSSLSTLMSTADSLATFTSAMNFSENTDLGDTKVTVELYLLNTELSQAALDNALASMPSTSTCGGQASGNECTADPTTCPSGSTCVDTEAKYCCYRSLTATVQLRINTTFLANYGNLTTTDSQTLINIVKAEVGQRLSFLNPRGCSPSINMSEVAILSGSAITVLELTIINATYTVEDIVKELQKSTGSTTSLGSIIGAGDFDECAANYTAFRNCDALASCLNFAGSFSCQCHNSTFDNSTGTATGTTCITPVTVDCSGGSAITASVLSDYYTRLNISLDSLHLALDSCNRTTHSVPVGASTEFTIPLNDCGTVLTASGGVVTASNFITNLPSTGFFTGPEVKVPVECNLPANQTITSGFNGSVDVIAFPPSTSSGNFSFDFQLFTDQNFNVSYPATHTFGSSDTIFAMISILNAISGVSVRIDRCWGTPDANPNNAQSVTFISNGCPVTSSVRNLQLLRNGQGSAQFQALMFFFRPANVMYMHCDVTVCANTCQPTCTATGRRRRRRAADEEPKTITIVIRLNPEDEQYYGTGTNGNINTLLRTNNITIAVIGSILGLVLIFVLALIVILVFRKKRSRKDEYDLTHVNMHAIGVKPPTYS